jgi:hypothetical protein
LLRFRACTGSSISAEVKRMYIQYCQPGLS